MRVMALLAMMVVSAASLVSSLPELVEKNVLVVDGVSQGWAIEGWFCDPGFGWPSPVEGGGGVPVEPEKKGSIEGGGKRRLLRSRTSIEGGDMLYGGQIGLFAVIASSKSKPDLLGNDTCLNELQRRV